MQTLLRIIAVGLVIFIFVLVFAQNGSPWGHIGQFSGVPSGGCPGSDTALDVTTGKLYICDKVSATWNSVPIIANDVGVHLIAGEVLVKISGTCPIGTSEISALNGKMLRGTIAANSNVGTTGGNATITPTGTVAWPVGVPINGAIATGTFANVATATSGNCATTNIAAGTGSATACKATAPNLTVPAEAHTGSLTSPTISWPAGVPTFSGVAVDPSPSYVNVIFCSVN